MIILPGHKAVYVSCGRTGSHTMFAVLKEHYGGFHYKPEENYHRRAIPQEYAGWYVFRTVRNPYARAVSIWRALRPKHFRYKIGIVPFAVFAAGIADHRWSTYRMTIPQHVWHSGNDYHETLKIEDLDTAVERLPFWNGPEHVMPASNTTEGRPWIDEYNGQIAADIEKWAGPEFELYGYEKLT